MRPPPPRPAANAIASVPPLAPARVEVKPGSPEPPPDARLDLVPSERPTPRSTVIPRLPGSLTLSGMRPQLETLIFHGAPPVPPVPPARPPRPAVRVPAPPLSEAFQDVLSEELLSDAEIDDTEPSTERAGHESGGACASFA
jgi:hypothetical protein